MKNRKVGTGREGCIQVERREKNNVSKQVGIMMVFVGTADEDVDPFGREKKGKSSWRV